MESVDKVKKNTEAKKIKKQISKLELQELKITSRYHKKINELKNNLQTCCIHDEYQQIYEYEPGSYYDRCVYITKTVCVVCGKILYENRQQGGYG